MANGTGRPTNFKLGIRIDYDDLHHRHARWPQRSMVKVITSRHQVKVIRSQVKTEMI